LKKGTGKSKKSVHFNEQNLTEVKIFKSTDEPSAPNISHEEYMKIQEEVRKNPHIFKIEEIRKKEVTMDINQQKEPEIAWKFPLKIKLDKIEENLKCPITHSIINYPVITPSGITYERSAITRWSTINHIDPANRRQLSNEQLVNNIAIKNIINVFNKK
jgi:hypothetical protein